MSAARFFMGSESLKPFNGPLIAGNLQGDDLQSNWPVPAPQREIAAHYALLICCCLPDRCRSPLGIRFT